MVQSGQAMGLRSKPPMALGAISLFEQVQAEVREVWRASPVPARVFPPVELAVLRWATTVTSCADLCRITESQQVVEAGRSSVEIRQRDVTALQLVERWRTQIEDFFDPPRLAEISAPCYVCGERWAWTIHGGERTRASALAFVRDEHGTTTEARCLVCGRRWPPGEFKFLLAQIGKTIENVADSA